MDRSRSVPVSPPGTGQDRLGRGRTAMASRSSGREALDPRAGDPRGDSVLILLHGRGSAGVPWELADM